MRGRTAGAAAGAIRAAPPSGPAGSKTCKKTRMDSLHRPQASRLPILLYPIHGCRLYPLRRQHKEMLSATTRAPTRAPTKWMPAGLAHDDKYIAHHLLALALSCPRAHRSHPPRPTRSRRLSLAGHHPLATLATLTTLLDQSPSAPVSPSPLPTCTTLLTLGATTLTRYIAALLHGVKTPRLLERVMAETPRKPLRPPALQRILSEECQGACGIGFERWVPSMQSYL